MPKLIKLFFHCTQCIREMPAGTSPSDWDENAYEMGWTDKGFQVWCKRHERNVIHVDFEGRKHPADTGIMGDFGESWNKILPLVREALKNAKENGDDLHSAQAWAMDMSDKIQGLEDYPVPYIKLAVEAVMQES